MTLPPALRETIVAVATVMSDARDPWWIISGAAAAIHGAHPIAVADVDVMLGTADARRVFARLGVPQAAPSDHPRFRSELFGRWSACPLPVEFMASFHLRDHDGVWRPMQPVTRHAMVVGAATVFVPDVADLRRMFERFGRPKDADRIALLDKLA